MEQEVSCLYKLGSDLIVAISSAFIALIALFVAIWQGFVTRKHNRLSVRPRLQVNYMISRQGDTIGLNFKNSGTGPLIINSLKIIRDGKEYEFNDSSYKNLFSQMAINSFSFNLISKGFVIPENETKWLISTNKHKESEFIFKTLEDSLNNFSLEVIYSSIYNEKFSSTWSIK
ncbi:hypothetical protein [Endozoicomonas sp. ALB032]|uniref:hypothetical protein n=1 Tax=Endozoicomonas sp. ALB032 TaxID=3403082 RepID=UPI003BB5FCD0